MTSLFHISIVPKAGVTQDKVEEILSLGVDWYRYREGCYIVETTSDEDKWFTRLKPYVDPEGYLFICKFDHKHYNGWMAKPFWEWYRTKVNKLSGNA